MTTIIRNWLCFYTVTEYDYIDEYKMDIIGVAKYRPPTDFIPMGLTGIPRLQRIGECGLHGSHRARSTSGICKVSKSKDKASSDSVLIDIKVIINTWVEVQYI